MPKLLYYSFRTISSAPEKGKLEAINTPNAMCSHRINLADIKDIDKEVIGWLKTAYDNAG